LGGYDYRCETLVPSTTHLLITLNANGLNSLIKRHRLVDWISKQDLTICCKITTG
jgi:hypothetical protein